MEAAADGARGSDCLHLCEVVKQDDLCQPGLLHTLSLLATLSFMFCQLLSRALKFSRKLSMCLSPSDLQLRFLYLETTAWEWTPSHFLVKGAQVHQAPYFPGVPTLPPTCVMMPALLPPVWCMPTLPPTSETHAHSAPTYVMHAFSAPHLCGACLLCSILLLLTPPPHTFLSGCVSCLTQSHSPHFLAET